MEMKRQRVSCEARLPLTADLVYHCWNDRSWYPRFIPGVHSVEIIDAVWSRWHLAAPDEPCHVELTDNVLHHYLAWRLHKHHDESMSVWIQEAGEDSSVVRLEIEWRVEPGAPSVTAQEQRAAQVLRQFRRFAESDPDLSCPSRPSLVEDEDLASSRAVGMRTHTSG
jgi:uncharacterized membrane protein